MVAGTGFKKNIDVDPGKDREDDIAHQKSNADFSDGQPGKRQKKYRLHEKVGQKDILFPELSYQVVPVENQNKRDGISENEKKRHVVAFRSGLEIIRLKIENQGGRNAEDKRRDIQRSNSWIVQFFFVFLDHQNLGDFFYFNFF
jgi:hypothetical protein